MNLSQDNRRSEGGNIAGAVDLGGSAQAASAQFTVGDDEDMDMVWLTEKGRKAITDNMAASIVRLEQEAEELRAEVALLLEQARILQAERDNLQDQRDFAMSEMERLKRERDEAQEALREIAAADWKTSGELRGMARQVLEARQ